MSEGLYYTLNKLSKLISQTPQETVDKIILIGGQALIAWVQAYNIDELTGEQFDHLASDDMDFMGNKIAVEECAAYWKGEAIFPAQDDHTPNTGAVKLAEKNQYGDPEIVDFLGATYGIPTEQVERYVDTISYYGDQGYYYVLSPPLCLLSRIKNITGYLKGASKDHIAREVTRIKMAVTITRKYLEELAQNDLEENESIRTKRLVNYLIKTILKDRNTKYVAVEYNIDFNLLFSKKIRSVNPDIYDLHITMAMDKFNATVQNKIRSRDIRLQQQLKKQRRLRTSAETRASEVSHNQKI